MITQVKTPTDVPAKTQYFIIHMKIARVGIPGDERSLTNPGHGYPEHIDEYNHYDITAADTIEEVQARLATLREQRDGLTNVLVLEGRKLEIAERIVINLV